MWHCAQGVHAFMRGCFHYTSADWPGNRPHPLKSWSAEELARMPTYYIMDRGRNMAETVAPVIPSATEIAGCRWLPEDELAVYAEEYRREGSKAGLTGTEPHDDAGHLDPKSALGRDDPNREEGALVQPVISRLRRK
jgi:hypothetical protein